MSAFHVYTVRVEKAGQGFAHSPETPLMTTRFDTAAFFRSHCRQPRGFGCWGFVVTRRVEFAGEARAEIQTVFTPGPMSFAEAKRWFAGAHGGPAVQFVSVAP